MRLLSGSQPRGVLSLIVAPVEGGGLKHRALLNNDSRLCVYSPCCCSRGLFVLVVTPTIGNEKHRITPFKPPDVCVCVCVLAQTTHTEAVVLVE